MGSQEVALNQICRRRVGHIDDQTVVPLIQGNHARQPRRDGYLVLPGVVQAGPLLLAHLGQHGVEARGDLDVTVEAARPLPKGGLHPVFRPPHFHGAAAAATGALEIHPVRGGEKG